MSIQAQNPKPKTTYDLIERSSRFAENIIKFAKSIPDEFTMRPIISQIIRSGTSIGANYTEADGAESKRDFVHKIALCKKESKETMYWLCIIARTHPEHKSICRILWKEAHEFSLIFSSIFRKSTNC